MPIDHHKEIKPDQIHSGAGEGKQGTLPEGCRLLLVLGPDELSLEPPEEWKQTVMAADVILIDPNSSGSHAWDDFCSELGGLVLVMKREDVVVPAPGEGNQKHVGAPKPTQSQTAEISGKDPPEVSPASKSQKTQKKD